MSFSKVYSAQAHLTKASIISIEVDLSRGLHSFTVVGLPDKAVEESRDRISAAIKNSGFSSPKVKNQKVVISLAPADLKKEGPIFDVPMALAYLLACDEIRFDPRYKLFLGELSLNGEIRPISGVLPLAREAAAKKFKEIFVPKDNAREAALIHGIRVYGIKTMAELIAHLDQRHESPERKGVLKPESKTEIKEVRREYEIDIADIHGQENAKRALEIAAAGGHNIALYGPPGTGKTMLAKAFSDLLPSLSFEEVIEVTSIHSVAGLLKTDLINEPPFRAPHHTASYTSIVGGGNVPKPGEMTLAHRGVLFMDEFPEFERRVIDALRQPLEEGVMSITRARGVTAFPARVILVVAMNPCPCGYYGSNNHECTCTPKIIERYQRKISGPIVDRIDLWVEVAAVDSKLFGEKSTFSKTTEEIRNKIAEARKIQALRFQNHPNKIFRNSEMRAKDIVSYVDIEADAKRLLISHSEKLGLSGRAYHRLTKVARTIADLDKKRAVDTAAILEALQYRPKKVAS